MTERGPRSIKEVVLGIMGFAALNGAIVWFFFAQGFPDRDEAVAARCALMQVGQRIAIGEPADAARALAESHPNLKAMDTKEGESVVIATEMESHGTNWWLSVLADEQGTVTAVRFRNATRNTRPQGAPMDRGEPDPTLGGENPDPYMPFRCPPS